MYFYNANYEESKEYSLVQDVIEHWHLNKNDERKGNEKKWYRKKGPLTVRFFNFQYAMKKTKTIEDAIDYARLKLFDYQMNPIYLPDLLATKAGVDPKTKNYSYHKILNPEVC